MCVRAQEQKIHNFHQVDIGVDNGNRVLFDRDDIYRDARICHLTARDLWDATDDERSARMSEVAKPAIDGGPHHAGDN